MADCYLRKEIGSNVFKKMKDYTQSRYYGIMSNYYQYAWQYGVGQNANQNNTNKVKGGAAGSGIHLPEDFQEQNIASMDKLREQMGTGKAMTYISNIANIDKQLKENITSDKAKELKEEKDMNVKALYSLGQTQAGRTEIIGDLTSVFQDREKAVAYYEGMIENYGNSPATGVPYASPKTENADVYLMLKQWRDTPYLIDNSKDRAIIDSYINKIEYGHPILEKDLPELQELIGKYTAPEAIAKAEEYGHYVGKADDLYNMLKSPNSQLTEADIKNYWPIYNNLKSGKELNEYQLNMLSNIFPEYRDSILKIDDQIEDLIIKADEEIEGSGGGGGGIPPEGIQTAKEINQALKSDQVMGFALFNTIKDIWNTESRAIFPSAGEAIEDAGIFTPKTVGPITYNPATGMVGLSMLPDIPAMIIAPMYKSIFGYDPETGAPAKPTVGDWVSTILTFAGAAAEAKGVNVLSKAKDTTSSFMGDSTGGLFPKGKQVANVVDDTIKQTAETISKTSKTVSDTDRAFWNEVNKIEHIYNKIGDKNYPAYKLGDRTFTTVEDTLNFLNAKRNILSGTIDDAQKFFTDSKNISTATKGVADDLFEKGAKYSDDFWDAFKATQKEAYKEAILETRKSPGLISKAASAISTVLVPIYLAKEFIVAPLQAQGFAAFTSADTFMQSYQYNTKINDAYPEAIATSLGNFIAARDMMNRVLIPQAELAIEQRNTPIWGELTYRLGNLMTGGMHTKAVEAVAKNDRVLTDAAYNLYAYGFITSNNWKEAEWRDAKGAIEWYNQNKTATVFNDKGTGQYRQLDPMREVYTWIAKNPNEWNQMVKDNTKPIEQVIFETTGYKVDPKTLQPVDKDKEGSGGGGAGKPGEAPGGLGGRTGDVIPGKSVSDRINTLLADKTLDKFQIKTLGETFKIPGIDKLNNLLSSDKIQEAKDYLSNKLSEVVPGYKPYEKSAWSTPGSNFTPDRSGICLTACQNACQTAQVYRSTSCGATQLSAFNTGGGSGGGGSSCGAGEAFCTSDVCGQAERLERWEYPTTEKVLTAKDILNLTPKEPSCNIAQAYVSTGGGSSSCPYDLSGYNIGCTEAGGLPVENKGSEGGNVPMQYCDSGNEICSQSSETTVTAAEASCRGCETVWQMGCMSKELGLRKKR